jgi:hypothetical protein
MNPTVQNLTIENRASEKPGIEHAGYSQSDPANSEKN